MTHPLMLQNLLDELGKHPGLIVVQSERVLRICRRSGPIAIVAIRPERKKVEGTLASGVYTYTIGLVRSRDFAPAAVVQFVNDIVRALDTAGATCGR